MLLSTDRNGTFDFFDCHTSRRLLKDGRVGMLKSILAGVFVFTFTTLSARADKVYLTDDRVLSGSVEKHKDGSVTITYPNDPPQTFSKDDVKRVDWESRATPDDVTEWLTDFEELLAPALGILPDQRKFLERRGSAESEDSGPSGTHTHKSKWTIETEVGRLMIGNEEFVEKWNDYAAHLAAIVDTERYKKHTKLEWRKSSLREFATNPPPEFSDLSKTVGKFLESVDELVANVEAAERRIKRIAGQRIQHDEKIGDAQDSVGRQKVENHGRRDRDSGKDVERARERVEKLKRDKKTSMDRADLAARTAKMTAAARRIHVLTKLKELHLELDKNVRP